LRLFGLSGEGSILPLIVLYNLVGSRTEAAILLFGVILFIPISCKTNGDDGELVLFMAFAWIIFDNIEYSKFTVSEPKLKFEGRKFEIEGSTFVASVCKTCGVVELLAAASLYYIILTLLNNNKNVIIKKFKFRIIKLIFNLYF